MPATSAGMAPLKLLPLKSRWCIRLPLPAVLPILATDAGMLPESWLFCSQKLLCNSVISPRESGMLPDRLLPFR